MSLRETISSEIPDWSREAVGRFEWAPSRQLLRAIRTYQRCAGRRSPFARARAKLAVFQHRFWSVVTGADIPLTVRIGGGLLMPHPNGIVVHKDAVIGPNCLLMQQVTLGAAESGVPRLGGRVDCSAGALILGGITLGDQCIVGAGAVVLHDVAAGATVVGMPARALARRST